MGCRFAAAALHRSARSRALPLSLQRGWAKHGVPRATLLTSGLHARQFNSGTATLDKANSGRTRRLHGASAAPLTIGAIEAAVAEISAALQQGDVETMKSRSASLFLDNYEARAKTYVDAPRLLQKEPDFFGALLQTCVDTGRLATARNLFASLEATPDAPAPDAAAYGAMILGYCAQRVPDRALPLLRAAMASGMQLEDETWLHSQIIHALGQSNKLRQAEALLPDLTAVYAARDPPQPLPRVIYRRLVQACTTCGEFEQALTYADELQLMYQNEPADPRQDETLIGYIIDGCFRARSAANADRLLEWLREQNSDGKRRYDLVEQHYNQLIRLFGTLNRSDKAMEVLELMRADVGVSTSSYNSVLSGFAHTYDTKAATAMFQKMRGGVDGAPRPDVHTFNHMILCFGRARQLQESFMYFRMIFDDDFRMEPNTMSYARLIEACGENLRLEEAEAVFGEMKAQRVPPDDLTYRALIKAAGRRKDIERAWELFDEMLEEYLILPSVPTYTALIHASSHVGDTSRAFEAYDHLLAEGLTPSLSVFNALIWVCGETKDMEGAFRVLKEMGRAGIPPDVRCYSRLLRACGVDAQARGRGADQVSLGGSGTGGEALAVQADDNVDLAGELVAGVADKEEDLAYASQLLATLERIKVEDLPRNRALYLALLRSAGRARQARLVFRVFEEMKREGIKPDKAVYTHLLNACRQCGRLNACEAVFTQMKEHEPPIVNSVSYNIVMAAAAECSNPMRSLELFDEMTAAAAAGNSSLEPDGVSYITAMSAAAAALQPDRAFEFFRALQASTIDSSQQVEERTWCLLIKACGEAMDYERAMSVFNEARESGSETTVLIYNAIMNAAGKVFDTIEMDRLFQDMRSTGIRPNTISSMVAGVLDSYNILMHVSGELKQLDQVKQRYAEMLELGLRPDAVTYSVLIGAAGKSLDLELAFEFFEQLKQDARESEVHSGEGETDISVSTVTFINLINACEACGRLDRAFEVFDEMKTSGFIPNVATYTALLHACVEARREEEALNVLNEMVEMSLPVEAENLLALKFACEANAYDSCVKLIDTLLSTAAAEMQLQVSALGFGDVDTMQI